MEACNYALQVPLGPVHVNEELEYLVIRSHDLGSEEDVQRPWGGIAQEEGGREGSTVGGHH